MAALLVAVAIMAVLMSVALPVWRHDAQREKEEELVWRGQQYIRAIRLFNTRTQTLPASVDILVQGHYLRKKFKDPVTNEDFVPIPAAGSIPGQGGQTVGGGRTGQPGQTGRGGGTPTGGFGSGSSIGSGSTSAFSSTTVPGGMIGVTSKSKDESIRLYQGRNHYNEWTFIFVNTQPGGPGGRGQPGGPGGRGQPGTLGGRGGVGGAGGGTFGSPGGGTFGGPGGVGPFGAPGRGGPGGPGTGPGRGGGTPVPVPGRGGRGGS